MATILQEAGSWVRRSPLAIERTEPTHSPTPTVPELSEGTVGGTPKK